MSVLPRWPELRELTRHRSLAFIRQPEALFWVFAFPVILAAVLSFAFRGGEVAPSRVGVVDGEVASGAPVPSGPASGTGSGVPAGVDGSGTGSGRATLADGTEELESSANVELVRFSSRQEAERQLAGGHVDALLVSAAPVEMRLDPTRPEAELARLRVLVALGGTDAGVVSVDEVTEHGSRYIDFLFPGLLGMSLMGTGLWAVGFAVADMRQRKVLKRLLVTPMRRSSFLASFLTSRLVFLALELLLITSFGVWALGVPFRGGLLTFSLVCVVGAVSFSALGLLVASRAKTIEGMSGLLNLVMVPMWLGSGVFFSYERFPEEVQPLLRALPLTALNDALRAGMIDGAGVAQMLPELGMMLGWIVVPFVMALKLFRWT